MAVPGYGFSKRLLVSLFGSVTLNGVVGDKVLRGNLGSFHSVLQGPTTPQIGSMA